MDNDVNSNTMIEEFLKPSSSQTGLTEMLAKKMAITKVVSTKTDMAKVQLKNKKRSSSRRRTLEKELNTINQIVKDSKNDRLANPQLTDNLGYIHPLQENEGVKINNFYKSNLSGTNLRCFQHLARLEEESSSTSHNGT
jgi:hypothetical protein